MSRKKRGRPEPAAPQPVRRRVSGTAIALVALAAVALAVVAGRWYGRRPITFPAPAAATRTPEIAYADFVGAETCAECHRPEYEAWAGSTHGRAGGPPTRQRVIAPFDGRPIQFRDAAVTPTVTAGGDYLFTVAQRGRAPVTFKVVAVVGGGFMAGGGTQAFFSTMPDGTVRFLPFDFSRAQNTWVCNTIGRANKGVVPIAADLALADCGDWPPTRVLGSHERFEGCQQCHGSQIMLQFDTTAKRYDTKYTTLAVNCESCHGPGRRHVELARSGHLNEAGDIGMQSLATLSKRKSLEVCFQCHSVKTAIQPDYLPGSGLQAHFALKFPGLLDTLYFADGRTRAFAYQEGHLSSDCYLNGSMTCVDCHDPHTQRYRDIYGAPLPGRFDDGQCVDCHQSLATRVERHTHHAAGSAGSRCTSCHMPYLQEPSVGPRVRYARSDHTISIPRPLYDSRLGIQDGCQQCHRDRSPAQLQERIAGWYGEIKPRPQALAGALAADTAVDRLAAARLALSDSSHDPVAQFAGLAAFSARYLRPDMPDLEGEIVSRLEALAGADDRDVTALALATLHLTRGSDPAVRRFLAGRLHGLDSLDAFVRDRWAWTLRVRGNAALAQGAFDDARAEFLKAQEVLPDDPAVQRSLGIAYTRLRAFPAAAAAFKRSLELQPRQPQVLVELAYVMGEQGDADGAIATYRRALAMNPWESSALANLGLTYLRRGSLPEAIAALQQALAIDPALATADFLLASAYQRSGRLGDAETAVQRGLEFDPNNAQAHQMLDALRQGAAGPSAR